MGQQGDGIWLRVVMLALGIGLGVLAVNLLSGGAIGGPGGGLSTFATIFLGIFIEAAPFLMLGTVASGLVEVFVSQAWLRRRLPRTGLSGAFAGAALGMLFPVSECGAVPLARRLMRKGLPPTTTVAFLLAAPVVNPIVFASTASAFGIGPVLGLRFLLTFLIAVVTGLVFSVEGDPLGTPRAGGQEPIGGGQPQSTSPAPVAHSSGHDRSLRAKHASAADRLQRAGEIAAAEFFELGRYLVLGSALAAAMQVFIPQAALLQLGRGPLLSVLVMIGLAVLLSVGSTVDSFIALAFAGSFAQGSLIAFLVYGPMVDIKSSLMYLSLFKRKAVAYLVLLPLAMTVAASLFISLFVWP